MRLKSLVSAFAVLATFGTITSFASGWENHNGAWYYNNGSQYVCNNWVSDAGNWYFMDQNGVMKTGWVNVSGKWYYMANSGAMKTGWVLDGDDWYYMHPNGIMASGETIKSNAKKYLFDVSGKMVHDAEVNGVTYESDGAAIDEETEVKGAFTYASKKDRNRSYDEVEYEDYEEANWSDNESDFFYSQSFDENHDKYVKEVFERVNKLRKKHGRKALRLSSDLCQFADIRAEELTENFSHTRPDGASCFSIFDDTEYEEGAAAENVAKGHRDPEEVVTGWYNSSGHKKNMLNTKYSQIGIGYYVKNGSAHWVQLFFE